MRRNRAVAHNRGGCSKSVQEFLLDYGHPDLELSAMLRPLALFLLATLSHSSLAATVICESVDKQHRYCGADTRGGVQLRRQLSEAECREGRSWGHDRGGIWVSRGCRAEFSTGYGGRPDYGRPQQHHRHDRDDDNDDATAAVAAGIIALGVASALSDQEGRREQPAYRIIACESQGGDRHHCRLERGAEVRFHRQLSSAECVRGDTWDTDRRGVWVDYGCRAEFKIYE